MFDKIKQMNQLRELQKKLKEEKAEVEKDGVKVVVMEKWKLKKFPLTRNLVISVKKKRLRMP